MKIITFIIFFIFFHCAGKSQLTPLHNFKTDKYDKGLAIFRIKGKRYKTNFSRLFLSKTDTVFSNSTTALLHFMIYNKKYLFVGYYPESQRKMAVGFELRPLNRVEVIDLKDPARKWEFDFKDQPSFNQIDFFNSIEGTVYYNKGKNRLYFKNVMMLISST